MKNAQVWNSPMASHSKAVREPRKLPRQARSQVTVDAIFEATLQVLLSEGPQRLTTTRVAERAGVSVGTLYQYYPNKQALLVASLKRHLTRVGDTIEAAALAARHTPLETMVAAIVAAFVSAKTARIDEARALYSVASELDFVEIVQAVGERSCAALAAMLATTSDVRFDELALNAFMFATAMVGPTRAMLEGGAPPKMLRALRGQLESLCLGYLMREAVPRSATQGVEYFPAQHQLPTLFVRDVADEQMRGRSLQIAQAALQDVVEEYSLATAIAYGVGRDIDRDL